jgi:hypothetical protein
MRAGYVPGACRVRAGCVLGACRVGARYVPCACRVRARCVPGTIFRQASVFIARESRVNQRA